MRTVLPLIVATLAGLVGLPGPVAAQDVAPPAPTLEAAEAPPAGAETTRSERRRSRLTDEDDGAIVTFAGDAALAAGESTGAVVAILGSARSEGNVDESVVSMLGSTRVTGRVGESAVAILGNVYIDGVVEDEVVALLGDVELGPNARVGDVAIFGGTLTRDPAAIVRGKIEQYGHGLEVGDFGWLKAWVENCLFYLRPLALAPGLGWAWSLAIGFLVFYAGLALLFRGTTERCMATLEQAPGKSLLAALLGVLLTPMAFLLLLVSVVGIAVIPFLATTLFVAGLFGKMVVLAWLGRRGTRYLGPLDHPAVAVLVGGSVMLAVYVVPVLGLVVYKLLGVLGLGVVLYTLLLAWQATQPQPALVTAGPAAPDSAPAMAPVDAEPASADARPASPAPSATLPGDATSLPKAGFWIRMGALLVDAVLLGMVLAVLGHAGSSILILLAGYGAIMWKLKSTTIGGSICGLKVVRLDGRAIDWSTAIVRALGCFLSLVVGFLGFIWVVFDNQKQSWHDKIAGTTVVRVPKGVSLL